jgi:hypothetical protein
VVASVTWGPMQDSLVSTLLQWPEGQAGLAESLKTPAGTGRVQLAPAACRVPERESKKGVCSMAAGGFLKARIQCTCQAWTCCRREGASTDPERYPALPTHCKLFVQHHSTCEARTA